ncbi:class GN sortase [Photobacterium profundum]|nr:class GN sortase [Photobacterium profundum]PSV64044.1 class GN sortase [Photobacterium profundum]
MMLMLSNVRTASMVVVLSVGLLMMGRGGYIQAKAWLAQVLIAQSWQQQTATGIPSKPWPWADTSPIAQLILPNGERQTVLAGVSGRNLAFGPTLQLFTAKPNEQGNVVIYGHNDTHFRSLEKAKIGDAIEVQDEYGKIVRYIVTRLQVVNQQETKVAAQTPWSQLTLITCYPFTTVSVNGPLRWVVTAIPA